MEANNMWEKSYRNTMQLWGPNPEPRLMQYFDLIKIGNVLDLGIGEGRNSIPFAFSGFNIDGVDISETAVNRCREKFDKLNSTINLVNSDLRNYHIKKDNYTLIIAANTLNFFKKPEIDLIIEKAKAGLQEGGMLYLSVFSVLDPNYKSSTPSRKQTEKNTFYIEERDSNVHYFTQEEVTEYFSDLKLMCLYEGIEYDGGHGSPHYHGVIEFIGERKGTL